MEYQELKKKEFDLLALALDWKDKKCCECGDIITRNNFGILHADYCCCNNILCQVTVFGKIEDETKKEKKKEMKIKAKVIAEANKKGVLGVDLIDLTLNEVGKVIDELYKKYYNVELANASSLNVFPQKLKQKLGIKGGKK